ncbi:MAG: O-antigen ligase family protein [Deltaproteobacteria bacterium]
MNIISPHTSVLWQTKVEALKHIYGSDTNLSNTISLYPFVTREKLLLYLSYAAFFVVVADYIRSTDQIKRFFWIIFTVAITESVIGLLQYIASGTEVPASGTYINPNHFASLLIVIIPLFLGYILNLGAKQGNPRSRWEKKFKIHISSQPTLLFATSLMALSLILSQSRGAILSLVASILFFYVVINRNKKTVSVKWLLGLFFLVIVVYSLWIGLDPVIEKFSASEKDLPKRTYIWKDSVNLIKDFPVFGTGLGNFSLAYTMYKNEAYWPRVYEHAHNDYIEFAVETGFIGLILIFWAIIAFYKVAISSLTELSPNRDPLRFYLFLGCISGMFGLLIHSITEFNFQIPSNTYYFIFLLGLSSSLLIRLKKGKTHSA